MQEISPAMRARLQKCFEYGNQKLNLKAYDYATEMFAQCVCGDPSNILYLNSFVVNLREKFKDHRPKSSVIGFVRKAKNNVPIGGKDKPLEVVIKDGVERLKKNPWDAQTFVEMGMACLADDLEEPGLAYLNLAVKSDPDNVEINRLAARELGERQKYDDALACWTRVSKLLPKDIEASKMISDLMLEKTINRVNTANHEKDEAAIKEAERERLSVEDQCEKKLRKNPKDRDAFVELVDYFTQKGNLRKAEDACKRAIKALEIEDDPVFTPQLIEIQKNRAREELARLKQQYEKTPTDAIKEKFAQQKHIFEQKTYESIKYRLKKSPNLCSLHQELGNFLMQHGKYKEAISEFQVAKADAGIAGPCLLALALCFQQIKQYRLAFTHYEQAIKTFKASVDTQTGEDIKRALYYGARLAYGLEKYEQADDFANQLAAIDFSYKDVGGLLDKIAEKRHNN